MRTRQTFVLHLLADPEEPQALRGVLQAVASGEEQPFADGPALLALLRRMVNATPDRVCDVDAREGEEEKGQQ
ncbi:MAG: hypothetical protein ACUVWZ_14475 [Anaerolineae bacterium]